MALCSKELSQNLESIRPLTTHWLHREAGAWSLLPHIISGFSFEEECENGELKGTGDISPMLLYATENSRPAKPTFQPLETGMAEDSFTG